MYEKILVPLDGSELAEVSLPYAEELAGRLGSEITLIYVRRSAEDPYDHMHRFYIKKTAEVTKQGTERYLEKPVGKAIKVESRILVGHAAEEIVDYADKADIGLIVMATHGRSGIRRWALGNVAEKVVGATGRPMLLIRAKDARPDVREKGTLNKVLVPLDGSKESEAVIPYVEELSSKFEAQVILLHIFVPSVVAHDNVQAERVVSLRASGKDYIEKVAAQLKQRGIAAKAEFREGLAGAVAKEIFSFADEVYADVVAMSTHGHSGIGLRVFGSTTASVLERGNTPILLVRPRQTESEQS